MMKAKEQQKIILEKIYDDSEPTDEELEASFPSLFSKETLVTLEKKNPIRRDFGNSEIAIPEPNTQNILEKQKLQQSQSLPTINRAVFSLTEVPHLKTKRGQKKFVPPVTVPHEEERFIKETEVFTVQEVKYPFGGPPPFELPTFDLIQTRVIPVMQETFKPQEKSVLVHNLLSKESCEIIVETFWICHCRAFHPISCLEAHDQLLAGVAEKFANFVLAVTSGKTDTFKYYHYCVAKAIFEAFIQTFPTSLHRFDGAFKRDVYRSVIDLFIGDFFTFEFHIEMFRQMFGDSDVRDLLRVEKKKANNPLLFNEPESFMIDNNLKKLAARLRSRTPPSPPSFNEKTENVILDPKARWRRSLNAAEDKNSEEIAEELRIPVYWNKFTFFSGYSRLTFKNFDSYLCSPLIKRHFKGQTPQRSIFKFRFTEFKKPKEDRMAETRAELLERQQEITERYNTMTKEIQQEIWSLEDKLQKSNNRSKVEELVILNGKREDVHQFCGELLQQKQEKEKRFKTIQANIDDFGMLLERGNLIEEEEEWYTQPLGTVLKPIDWVMMESLRKIVENKQPITDFAYQTFKKPGRPSAGTHEAT